MHELDQDCEQDRGPSPDAFNLLITLERGGGGLDIRALIARMNIGPDRLKAAIADAQALGRVRVRLRAARPGLPPELDRIARVAMTRRGRRWGLS